MLGSQCCQNPPVLDPTSGSGHVEKLAGLDTYISGSPDSKLCILLVCDIFGYQAPILRELADRVAASGFYVVVPDYFYGDHFNISNSERLIPAWMQDHTPEKGFEDTMPLLEALKSKGITSIGAAGMCWGAKVAVELNKHELIKAAVLLHPTYVTVDDIKGVKAPIAILGAEIDHLSPPSLVKQFEEILASKPEVNSYVKVFPNVTHGWTIRYKSDDVETVKAAKEAHDTMLDWFVTYVK